MIVSKSALHCFELHDGNDGNWKFEIRRKNIGVAVAMGSEHCVHSN